MYHAETGKSQYTGIPVHYMLLREILLGCITKLEFGKSDWAKFADQVMAVPLLEFCSNFIVISMMIRNSPAVYAFYILILFTKLLLAYR